MRIAVTAVQPGLDAEMDPRFGRCPFFVIVETDNLSFEALDNDAQTLGQGAGIQAARLLADRGVKYVLTGNCGPNAHQTLTAAGVGVVVGCAGTVRSVVEQFTAGRLQPAGGPNVRGHVGMTAGPAPAPSPAPTPPPVSPGPGQGCDPGPGRGQGRGMGRGRGGGGGGGGRGRGGGRGMGGGGGIGGGRRGSR